MSRPTSRVLAMLELLQARHGATVGQLAASLGVDERTVRRYGSHLADLGIPVEARRGRYGGYRLAAGYKLPPLMFSDDEALAVVLGLLAGRRAGLGIAASAGESALAKIQRVLPAALRARTEALLATLDFTAPVREGVNPATDTLLELAAAARDRQPVAFGYTTFGPASTAGERRLDPYGLVFHAGRWYVTGHDHDRGAVRTFRLDRITAVRREAAEAFVVPVGFDPVARVTEGLAAVPYAHEVEVVLHTSIAEARRRIPPVVAALSEVADGVRLVGRAERLDGMARLLAGLGWGFVIVRPDALRAEVRAVAAALLAAAAGSGAPAAVGSA